MQHKKNIQILPERLQMFNIKKEIPKKYCKLELKTINKNQK